MATTKSEVQFKIAYQNTDFTRQVNLDCTEENLPFVKSKIKLINASLNAGTSNGLDSFFISDTGEHMKEITDAYITVTETTVLDLGGVSSGN